MNSKLLPLLLCALSLSAVAAEGPSREGLAAPNKKYLAVITQPDEKVSPIITIQNTSGQALVRLETGIIQFYPETAHWSPDSQVFAIAGGYHGLQEPFIFVRTGDHFHRVSIPYIAAPYDNAQIRPVRWLTGRRLILDISGPHIGHAGYSFRGRATIRILTKPPRYETLYKKISSRTYDEDR